MEILKKNKSESFSSLFKQIISRFPEKRRGQFWILFLGMVIAALLETFATISIAIFASIVSSPDHVLQSEYTIAAQRFLNLTFLTTIKGLIISSSIFVLLLIVIKNSMQILVEYKTTRFAYLMDEYFGSMLFDGFLRMPYKWHLTKNTADIILALEWRVFIGSSFIKASFQILSDIFVVCFILVAILYSQPMISIILIIILGCTSYLIHSRMILSLEKTADQCRKYDKSINREVTKGIHGIKDLKISGRISTFTQYFKENAFPLANYRGLQSLYKILPKGILETLGFFMLTGSVCLMLFIMKSSTANIAGTITLLAVSAWRVLPAINRILGGFTSMRTIMPYTNNEIGYIQEIENFINNNSFHINSYKKFRFNKEIRMDNVSFTYSNNDTSNVINDMSFEINKGQTLGFVGSSGAGKSTIVDILIGLLEPSSGELLIDGNKLDTKSRYEWMSSVGYVPQSPYIFDGSLAENIAFGYNENEIDRSFVLKCCEMAYMQDFLNELTHGIDTNIGERGVRLSGGQQQRVSIARALYTKPDVIIFDEATSSLDSKSEKAIQNTIYSLKGEHTLIIIAHRLSTVMDCDLLIWIEKGEIKMIDKPNKVLNEYEYKK